MTTGIGITKGLEEAFASARHEKNVRFLKVVIENESLVLLSSNPLGASVEADFKTFAGQLEPKKPCYIVFRLDSTNQTGHEWILLSYVPDGSPVKDRMLYAATKDNLKKQLGYSYFVEEMQGSQKEDLTYDAYLDRKNRKNVEAPLTAAEMQLKAEASHSIHEHYGGASKEYVHSVKFPLSSAGDAALAALAAKSVTTVQLSVDTSKETIELVSSSTDSASGLASAIFQE